MDVVVKLCDRCMSTGKHSQALSRSVTEYEITEGSRKGSLTLCTEHGEPFESALPGRPGRKPVNDPGPTVVPPTLGIGSVLTEPVAPKKVAVKKAAAKKAPARRPAKKAAAKKAAAKKTVAKKAPAAAGGRRGRVVTTPEAIAAGKAANA